MEEIIFESETSKGSFYHYFDGKDALLSSLSVLFDERYEDCLLYTSVCCSCSHSALPTRRWNPCCASSSSTTDVYKRQALYYCFPQGGGDVVAKTRLAAEELYKLKRAAKARG